MITGKDETSLRILSDFEARQKLADIAAQHKVSLDQVKRLKRYYNYIKKIQQVMDPVFIERFTALGLKGLVLAPLFKENDYEAIASVLSQTTADSTREQLTQLVAAAQVKNERVQAFSSELETFKADMKQRMQSLEASLVQLASSKQMLLKQLPELERYPEAAHDFLAEYIGPYENGWALRKRLDSGFRRSLAKDGVIELSEYVWVIRDLDELVKRYIKRKTNGYYIAWNYEREVNRNPMAASNDEYKAIKGAQEQLLAIEHEIQSIESNIEQLHADLRDREHAFSSFKKETLQSFEESSRASDALSERDLLRHADLQSRAMKWLYMQGGVVCSELTLPNGRRADVVGYLPNGEVVVIEVKASYEDYKRDDKWREYLPYCDRFYFAMKFPATEKDVGVLEPARQLLQIRNEDQLDHTCEDRAAICWRVNRKLSERYVYGF